MKRRKTWIALSLAALAGSIVPPALAQTADVPSPIPLQRKAPAGAPNIVLVLLDDVGFGAAATFGDLRRAGADAHA